MVTWGVEETVSSVSVYSNVKKIEAVTMVTTLTRPFFTADAEIKREKKKRILHVLLDLLNEFRKPTKY